MRVEEVEDLQELKKEKDKLSGVGAWTPAITTYEGKPPTVEYTERRGLYIKLGKLVYIEFKLRGKITALNGTNNYAMIKGLPFSTRDDLSEGREALSKGVIYNMLNSSSNVTLQIHNDSIKPKAGDGTSATKLIVTPAGNYDYFEIGGNGWYLTK